jgi:hypothetical protein
VLTASKLFYADVNSLNKFPRDKQNERRDETSQHRWLFLQSAGNFNQLTFSLRKLGT